MQVYCCIWLQDYWGSIYLVLVWRTGVTCRGDARSVLIRQDDLVYLLPGHGNTHFHQNQHPPEVTGCDKGVLLQAQLFREVQEPVRNECRPASLGTLAALAAAPGRGGRWSPPARTGPQGSLTLVLPDPLHTARSTGCSAPLSQQRPCLSKVGASGVPPLLSCAYAVP